MGYFNPIAYFLKSLIRIFTRKFFLVILICICLFLGFILFSNESKAATYLYDYNNDSLSINDKQYISNCYNAAVSDLNSRGLSYSYWYIIKNSWQPSSFPLDGNNMGAIIILFSNYNDGWYNAGSGLGFRNNNHNCSEYQCWRNTSSTDAQGNNNFIYGLINWNGNFYGNNFYMISSNTSFSNLFSNRELPSYFINPYIENSNDVSNWSFDTFNISLGSVIYDSNDSYYLRYTLNGVDYGIELRDYYNSSLGYFVVPRNQLTNNVVVRNNDSFDFTLIYRSPITVTPFELGTFTISISSGEQEQINQDSDKYVQGQILEQQKQTNEKLDDINNTQHETTDAIKNLDNTITDTNIDDITDNDLPSDDTEDITADGVNGIFTSIYNAFCTGNAQDIVFPIPFTDKNITLSPNYVYDMLTNSGASWVITIIQAFWWYLISRFIIKDVMNKINKIKSGNIEDIETTNIRGDML